MPDIAAVVRRAAQRVPGPVAERSLAQAQTIIARLRNSEALPLSAPEPTRGLLRVARDERWCRSCGETISVHGNCHRCGGNKCVPVAAILRSDEYYVTA